MITVIKIQKGELAGIVSPVREVTDTHYILDADYKVSKNNAKVLNIPETMSYIQERIANLCERFGYEHELKITPKY